MAPRFYLVTFDLEDSRYRTNEYRIAEEALISSFERPNYWKLVKQCSIVRTSRSAADIRDVLTQRLGRNCNILVVRLRYGYAFTLTNRQKRQAARNCLSQIPSI